MAGSIQSAVNSALGAVAAGVAISKGLENKKEKEEASAISKEREASSVKAKAQKEAKAIEIANTKLEVEQSRLRQEQQRESAAALKFARMQQKAKESYINAIKEKSLGTKMGTRTSMTDYLIAASGNTLNRKAAMEISKTMNSREIRKIKEEGGALSGNK